MGIDTRFHGAGRSNLGPRDERMVRIAGLSRRKRPPHVLRAYAPTIVMVLHGGWWDGCIARSKQWTPPASHIGRLAGVGKRAGRCRMHQRLAWKYCCLGGGSHDADLEVHSPRRADSRCLKSAQYDLENEFSFGNLRRLGNRKTYDMKVSSLPSITRWRGRAFLQPNNTKHVPYSVIHYLYVF
jgi:hypothetical protein